MVSRDYFDRYFSNISEGVCSVDNNELFSAASMIINADSLKNKILIFGNGGSSSIADHVTVDLVNAAGIRAVNGNSAGLITCFSNDYGYEQWVDRILDSFADPGDLVIMISSSGESMNIINGALKSKDMGLKVITFSGFDSDNNLKKIGDLNFWVDSDDYNVIEMTHHIWLLSIVDFIIEKNKRYMN